MEQQMGRVILCDIVDNARILEFPAIKENKNVEIKTQDNKHPFIFRNDDDKRVSNTANDIFDTKQKGECTSIYNAPVSFSWFYV